jgi:hypothetical protein
MGCVHGAIDQIQKARTTQSGQQDGVQARPDVCLGPVPQSAPGRDSRAAHALGRDVAPGDTGPQHVHDAGQGRSVRNTQPPGMVAAPFGSGR